ncbi:hypothetical protein DSECCO2_626010 [anaerobic digester metagenome]
MEVRLGQGQLTDRKRYPERIDDPESLPERIGLLFFSHNSTERKLPLLRIERVDADDTLRDEIVEAIRNVTVEIHRVLHLDEVHRGPGEELQVLDLHFFARQALLEGVVGNPPINRNRSLPDERLDEILIRQQGATFLAYPDIADESSLGDKPHQIDVKFSCCFHNLFMQKPGAWRHLYKTPALDKFRHVGLINKKKHPRGARSRGLLRYLQCSRIPDNTFENEVLRRSIDDVDPYQR